MQDELWPWLILAQSAHNPHYPDKKRIVRLLDVLGSKFQ